MPVGTKLVPSDVISLPAYDAWIYVTLHVLARVYLSERNNTSLYLRIILEMLAYKPAYGSISALFTSQAIQFRSTNKTKCE